jgi:hypothetical protein
MSACYLNDVFTFVGIMRAKQMPVGLLTCTVWYPKGIRSTERNCRQVYIHNNICYHIRFSSSAWIITALPVDKRLIHDLARLCVDLVDGGTVCSIGSWRWVYSFRQRQVYIRKCHLSELLRACVLRVPTRHLPPNGKCGDRGGHIQKNYDCKKIK